MQMVKRMAILLAMLLVAFMVLPACAFGDETERLSRYTIDAVLDDETKTLSVTQTVEYQNNYDIELSDIQFHLYPAAYREGARFTPVSDSESERTSAYPDGMSYGSIVIESVSVGGKAVTHHIGGQDEDILIVPLDGLLMPSSGVVVDMTYRIQIPKMRHRFGWYGKTINLGNFYPIACVYEQGAWVTDPYYAWGDPFYSEVADYTVSITAPNRYKAAVSGKAESIAVGAGQQKTTASMQSARDFAIVLGEFERLSQTVNGVEVLYYYYADATPTLSLQAAVDSIKTFSELFGDYPYESFSAVETAFLHGGMEYPGLVYISDRVNGELFREVVIHETAHQWWYAVVGNNQVKDAWIDEALTEYSTTLFFEKNPAYERSYSSRIADALGGYSLYCETYQRNPDFSTVMQKSLPEFKNSLEYTYMTYIKGQIMLDTLRTSIGEDAVLSAMKQYYSDHKFQIATPEHLIAAFENASKKHLSSFFTAWTEGKIQVFGS